MSGVTSAKRPLGVAVIGVGIGEQHARAYQGTPGCVLTHVLDLDPLRAGEAASRLGGVEIAASFDAVLADPAIDILSIASYDDAHFGQVVRALDHGKHVFVEKPLCRTLEEAREVKARCQRRPGLHVASNLVLRSAPLYTWLREEIACGALGEIYAMDGEYLYGRLHKITEGWRKDVSDYSVMLGGGVHLVDLMLWLTGQRPVSVMSAGNRISTQGTEFEYQDFVASTFMFGSGLVGRVTANFGCVHAHQHVLRVFGTKATFLYDDSGARLHVSRDPGVPSTPLTAAPLPATKGDLIPGFVADVQHRIDPAPALQHELDVICSCAAADRALGLDHAVPVEYA